MINRRIYLYSYYPYRGDFEVSAFSRIETATNAAFARLTDLLLSEEGGYSIQTIPEELKEMKKALNSQNLDLAIELWNNIECTRSGHIPLIHSIKEVELFCDPKLNAPPIVNPDQIFNFANDAAAVAARPRRWAEVREELHGAAAALFDMNFAIPFPAVVVDPAPAIHNLDEGEDEDDNNADVGADEQFFNDHP